MTTDSESPPDAVGLIGLGLLGTAIAERLRHAGIPVVGYDIHPDRCREFAVFGGEVARDNADVARRCRRIVLSLPDSRAVSAVVAELLPQLAPDALLIDTTTGDPTETALLAEELAGQRIAYVDATVGGSSEQARRGEVTVLAGGTAEDVADARDILDACACRVFHVGPCGSGARMKLVLNLVLGLNRVVLAEGLAFARACGVDPAQALEVLRDGPAYSRVMDTKGEKMLSGDFTPQARLAQHLKDVRLIVEAAAQRGAKTPFSELHRDVLQALVEAGCGELDNSAVIRWFEPHVESVSNAMQPVNDAGRPSPMELRG
jgi:3-hydroxyisobutyrate dehydrogenase-like beta-hydroxyacid dehydrogenase